jgi:urea transport system permease protein
VTQGGHPNTRVVLTAFMEGRLFFRNDDQNIFMVKSTDESLPALDLIDPLSLKPAGSAPVENLTLIDTNNHLRSVLRTAVARFGLSSPDPAVRLDSAREMLRSLDEPTVALLRQRSTVETNSSVKKEIATGLALAALDSTDAETRLGAVSTLRNSISQDVRNRLESLLDKSPEGTYVESDERVRKAAATAVKSIDRSRAFYADIEVSVRCSC